MIPLLVAFAIVPFAASQASVCLDLNSTQYIKDMKLDPLGQLFYIDIANDIFALRPNCGERSLIYNVDVPLPNGVRISVPTSLEFGVDSLGRVGLYVANQINSEGVLFFLAFDFVNFAILDAVPVPIVATYISELKLAPNGDLFAVDQQQAILRFNILTGDTTTYLGFGSGIVDIFDIATSQECPFLYVSANDNDEVWFCKDLQNGDLCVPLSGSLLHNPWGVDIDCKCQVYVSNDGNGNLRLFNPEVQARPTLQCAYEAERVVNGAYINRDGAFESDVAGGKVSYRFSRAGDFWVYAKCAAGGSWLINGDTFTIPATADFTWFEFGTPQSITNIFPIVTVQTVTPGCEIAKVFMGDATDGSRLPTELFDKECASSYVCASEFCLFGEAEIVDVPSQGPALNSPCSHGDAACAATGARIVFDEAIFEAGANTLYLETFCTSASSNSWIVNGVSHDFVLTADFTWQEVGVVTSPIVDLTPGEAGCKIRGAYLGAASGSNSLPVLPYPCTCCLKDTTVYYTLFGDIFATKVDASQLRCSQNFEATVFRDVRMTNIAIQQSCTFQPTPPSTASPSPSTSPIGVIACGVTVSGDTTSAQRPFSFFAGPNQGYTLTLSQPTHVILSTCGLANFDTTIGVFDAVTFDQILVNDDTIGCGVQSFIDANLAAGNYIVVLGGFFTSSSGPYQLSLTCPTESSSTTSTPTSTSTQTPSASSTQTSTQTSTSSSTQTPTASSTQTPSSSRTQTPSQTSTQTPTQTSTQTPSQSTTQTPSSSPTQTSSQTPTNSPSRSATQTSTQTPTSSATQTPSSSATQTPTQTPTQSSTQTPSSSQTSSASFTQTPSTTPVGSIVCGQTVLGSNVGGQFPFNFGAAALGRNVGYQLVISATTTVDLSLCSGTNFDTVVGVFDASRVLIASDNDGCDQIGQLAPSRLVTTLPAGTYFVSVAGFASANAGNFALTLTCPSATDSQTPSSSSTQTPTSSPTQTPTSSPTQTPSASRTQTPSSSATQTSTSSSTQTPSQSGTQTSTQTPSQTPTQSSTQTPSQTPTQTPTQSSTQTPSQTPTQTPSQSSSQTPSQTPSQSSTQTPTQSSTQTPSQTPSQSQTQTPTQTPSQTASRSATQTPTQSATQSPSQSTTQTPSQSSTQTPTRSATSSVSPSQSPSPTNVVTLSLNTIFAVGHDTGGASQGNQQTGSRTFTSGRGIAMAITLLRSVGGATARFVRFVGTDTLQSPAGGSYQIIQRFRLWSAVATLRLARCPVQTRVQSLSTFLKGRLLAFLAAIPDSPTSLDAETSFSLLLDDVADVECTPPVLSLAVCDPTASGIVTLCPSPLRARYTLGIVWGNEERPFILENGVTVSMEPFSSSTNPTFVGLSTFTSSIADSSNGLRTGVILNSQVQVVRTLFPECSTTKTVAAGTCASVLATSEVGQGKAAKSSSFCFVPPLGFQNSCGATTPSNFGCFCDECCYIFGDCCPDVEFCDSTAGVLRNECHSSATVVDPTLTACVQLCGTVTPL